MLNYETLHLKSRKLCTYVTGRPLFVRSGTVAGERVLERLTLAEVVAGAIGARTNGRWRRTPDGDA